MFISRGMGCGVTLAVLVWVGGGGAARVNAAPVDFSKEVLPLLQKHCWECHGASKQEGELRLDTQAGWKKGGASGAPVVAGEPGKSDLLRRVLLPTGDAELMPARGARLKPAQVDVLRRWVAEGAVWPDGAAVAKHWSYVPPVRPALPDPRGPARIENAIDRFVLSRLEREGMKPSPPASRGALLRRLSFDLTGLPPTPAEVAAFEGSTDPAAYERIVDELLARPQFGERWARPWLDLARYADSHGFQRDDLREIWAYRDWVIRALNDDMPFDRFTIEQLAGDLLPEATEAQRIATGFHRCTTTNVEAGSDPEETRVNQVFDRVNTTAAVWLGTTFECAQCHDHKYDPFTQKDYYRLFAYFNNTAMEADRSNPRVPGSIRFLGPTMPVAGEAAKSKQRDKLAAEMATFTSQLDQRRAELERTLGYWLKQHSSGSTRPTEAAVLDIVDFDSEESSYKKLDDGSILLTDDPPEKDTYVVTAKTKLAGITAIKLECLTDPSLPGKGPGRGDADRPNFVLHEFSGTVSSGTGTSSDADKKGRPLAFGKATASFSQAKFDVSQAVDGDLKTAWAIAPKFSQAHWAQFTLAEPVGGAGETTFVFTLVQNFGGGRTIGRFKLTAIAGEPEREPVPAEIAGLLKKTVGELSEPDRKKLVEFRMTADSDCKRLQGEIDDLQQQLAKTRPQTTLVMQELPEPREAAMFDRGDFRRRKEAVTAGTPAALPAGPAGPPNRLTLARWLIDKQNPLTARVTVNRLWGELFGVGLVSTPEDFGVKGDAPSHPELLDWLAVDFMEQGWSLKRVLRGIVLSATYQQDARLTPELWEQDDLNRWLARGPRFRLDAEMIRDNALAVSGLLSLKQFGPPIRPYQPDGLWTKIGGDRIDYVVSPEGERHRRGIYVVWKRGAPYPSFVNFDATARLACTIKRSRSNTPLQALTLLNDPVYVEAAQALARRIVKESPTSRFESRLDHAYRLCLSRTPRENERTVLGKLFDEQATVAAKNPKSAEQAVGRLALPAGTTAAEVAPWVWLASVLLNLDETITKP